MCRQFDPASGHQVFKAAFQSGFFASDIYAHATRGQPENHLYNHKPPAIGIAAVFWQTAALQPACRRVLAILRKQGNP